MTHRWCLHSSRSAPLLVMASRCAVLGCSVMSHSLPPRGLYPSRLLCPWDSSGKNTRMDCYALLLTIFPTQGLNSGLLHCRQILYHLSHQRSPASRWMVLKFQHLPVSPGILVTSQIIKLPPPRDSESVGLGWDSGVGIANKVPGDANADGLDTTLPESLF